MATLCILARGNEAFVGHSWSVPGQARRDTSGQDRPARGGPDRVRSARRAGGRAAPIV